MTAPRRVLIVHPYGIGDLLFITPILRALRLMPSVEAVDLLLGSRTESVVRSNPHVDQIFSIDKDKFHSQKFLENFREMRDLGRELRRRRYDLLLDFSLRREYAFFAQFFLGIRRRAGFAYKNRGIFHNIQKPLPLGFTARHVVDEVCDLAEMAGIPVEDRFLEFYLGPQDREAADLILKERFVKPFPRYAVVSPGGGESWGKDAHFKRWPAASFADFLQLLSKEISLDGVIVLGSRGEKELAENLVEKSTSAAFSLAGEISLETSAALLEKAAVFVGNDGGLVHLASALNVPILAFYGPVDPKVYGPYAPRGHQMAIYKEDLECRPCYQKFRYKSDCENRTCLQNLTAEEAMRFLSKRKFSSYLKTPIDGY